MSKYIYICGPVSGRDHDEAKAEFDKAAHEIKKKHGEAVFVVNPFDFCQKGEDWNYAMKKCIVNLTTCNYIHCLPGFEESKGARLEVTIAEALRYGVCDRNYDLIDYGE